MQSDSTIQRPEWALTLVLAATLAGGCTSVKTTGSSRSGTEQLLLTGAWDSALCTVDFRPLAGRRVFLDSQYVTVIDKDWIISSIRRAMTRQGVLLENDKSKAQVIIEAAVGAYGTDDRNCTAGLPQVSLFPSLLGTAVASGANSTSSSNSSSALTISQTSKQDAVVKAALFAYDAKSGEMVWESCPLLDAEGVRDHYVFGSGPYRNSSLSEVDQYPDEAQARTRRRLMQRWSGR